MDGPSSKPVFNKHATKEEKEAPKKSRVSRDDLTKQMAIHRSLAKRESFKEQAHYEHTEREAWQDNAREHDKEAVRHAKASRNLEMGIRAGIHSPEQREVVQKVHETEKDKVNRETADKITAHYKKHFKQRPTRAFGRERGRSREQNKEMDRDDR